MNFRNTVYSYFLDVNKDNPNIEQLRKSHPPIENGKAGEVHEGYGSFFSVNGFKTGSRKKTALSDVNGIHVDIDGTGKTRDETLMEMAEYLLPTIMNQTKNGFHCFWLLEKSITVDDTNREEMITTVEGMNKRLIALFEGDKAASDVTRVLRVPGSIHTKDKANPFTIKTVYENVENVYTLEELQKAFPPIIEEEKEIVYGKMEGDIKGIFDHMMKNPKISRLYNGDASDYNGDLSSADMAFCSHLAFWFQKDKEVMRNVWLGSPLGSREKTQSRKDYQDSTLDRAIERCMNTYTVKKVEVKKDSIPERDEYALYMQDPKFEDSKWVKKMVRLSNEYSLAFHDYFAICYPYFKFEKGEDKVYWNYNKADGVYVEMSAVSARQLVLSLLNKENMKQFANEHFAKNCLARYRAKYTQSGVAYGDFDNDDKWFHASNGWINLDTLQFIDHTPSMLSRRCSAVPYDSESVCPLYDKFMDQDLLLKKDQVRWVDQFSGLILTNNIRYQKMLTLIGKPGSGKSTLLNLWKYVLGDMATQKKLTDLSSESFRFAGSSLVGKTLCWFDEVDVKKSEMGNALGVLITGDSVSVERKGINGITENPNTLKCVLTANSLPLSAEHGMYRRITIIELEGSFYDAGTVIVDMDIRLKNEAQGVLNRMIRGLHDLKKMGGFTMISGQEDLIEQYKADSNLTSEFLDTYFNPTDDMKCKIHSADLFRAFKEFTGNRTNSVSSPQRFGQTIKTQPLAKFQHLENVRDKNGRYWAGLELKKGLEMDEWGKINRVENYIMGGPF